jgi:hypothetical protein
MTMKHAYENRAVLRDEADTSIAGVAEDGLVWVGSALAEANLAARKQLGQRAEAERSYRSRLRWRRQFSSVEEAAADLAGELGKIARERAALKEITRRFETAERWAQERARALAGRGIPLLACERWAWNSSRLAARRSASGGALRVTGYGLATRCCEPPAASDEKGRRTMDPTDLCYLPATELAMRIRRGEVPPVEVIDAVLARIERLNPVLNAYDTGTAIS